ncbi:hypothetical protein CMV_015785, partial [Castanea mollissima]
YTEIVGDCCCNHETVDCLNEEVLRCIHRSKSLLKPHSSSISSSSWPDDGMCCLRDCSVCDCAESEFPESFKRPIMASQQMILSVKKESYTQLCGLMDCVGCKKCCMWGKLQVLGLGTALKILFSVDGQEHSDQTLPLQWNEVIAVMNFLNRLRVCQICP